MYQQTRFVWRFPFIWRLSGQTPNRGLRARNMWTYGHCGGEDKRSLMAERMMGMGMQGFPGNGFGPSQGLFGPPQCLYGSPQGPFGPPQGSFGPPQGHYGPPQGNFGQFGPPQGFGGNQFGGIPFAPQQGFYGNQFGPQSNFGGNQFGPPRGFGDAPMRVITPRNMASSESDDQGQDSVFSVSLDVKGYKAEDVKVYLLKESVKVFAHMSVALEDGSRTRQAVIREFPLPANVDMSTMDSFMNKDGMLSIRAKLIKEP